MILNSYLDIMRNLIFTLLLLPALAFADNQNFFVNPSIGLYSDYMTKGVNEFDGTSIQPAVVAGYKAKGLGAIGAKVWAHFSGEGSDKVQEDFTEIDYTLSYSNKVGPLAAAVGYTFRTFPDNYKDRDTQPVGFVSVAAKKVPLKPYLSYYHDFEKDYDYIELTISHIFKVEEGLSISPYAVAAFVGNADGKTYKHDGMAHHSYGVSLDANFGSFVVSPSVNITREVDEGTDNEFWFGTRFGFNF